MKSFGNSFYLPTEEVGKFMKDGAMNNQEGIYLYGKADPSAKKFLPPPLEVPNPDDLMFYLYIVNIREPTFGPWYMEGGIGLMANYGDISGLYFLNLQLCGPGALMGAFSGREGSGLPKKICDKIVVERTGDYGHCYMERGGVRLVEVELEMGSYNVPDMRFGPEGANERPGEIIQSGGCFLHRYKMDAPTFKDMELIFYDSFIKYDTWEPATATITLNSTLDDPYGEIEVTQVLGAAWSKCDNGVNGNSTLYRYPEEEVPEVTRYLLAGRYDRSTMCSGSQTYDF